AIKLDLPGMTQTTPVPLTESGKTGGSERRRSTREPLSTPGLIRPEQPGARSRQVLIADVSLHGVGLRTTMALALGARFFVEIGCGPLHLSSRFEVVRCRQRTDGTWDIGGEFC